MARGNQREQAREKAQKKLASKGGGDTRSGTINDRNASDKTALEAKVAAKKAAREAEAAAEAAGVSGAIKKPKKKKAADVGMDDLLSAGLAGTGGKRKGKK
mmetsp:Transcript_7312/g.13293  ORF Transcript_7312/g.13293 Transcript_7312/m.13293 type:complete len:101 (+) Transcript_7312:346-648(+)|eukprot:CAMPEP_0201628848 /NCGR_PEP_ID=MMETSP0493-20130528/3702_1 /ASSEMBLY_ACC=CAM_ASM_000838 /TAXON_ID=420259 /ORGANISM="Thalassiosira gravida, Strain GMp14c1" /LENGTH=100 /DNA_ID=CAMNT_0048099723 /DNA_START=329 /DNA_END=631 /DNA_ORIENTATION=-